MMHREGDGANRIPQSLCPKLPGHHLRHLGSLVCLNQDQGHLTESCHRSSHYREACLAKPCLGGKPEDSFRSQ